MFETNKTLFIKRNLIAYLFFAIIYYFMPNGTFNTERKLTLNECLYFSCTTHTTLGLGDIYPITNRGRNAVMLQIVLVFLNNASVFLPTGFI